MKKYWLVEASCQGGVVYAIRSLVYAVLSSGVFFAQGCSSHNPGAEGQRVSALMKELDDTIHRRAGQSLKKQPVNWSEAEPLARRYAELAGYLRRMVPEKGSLASWEKQTDAFAATAERLRSATTAHDRIAALESWNDLQKSCANCHDNHR